MHFRITGATIERAQQAIGDISGEDLDKDQSEVVTQIFRWLQVVTIGDENVVFVAEGTEDDRKDAAWEMRGMITLSKTPNGWYINDLISLGGVGGKLTQEAFKHIRNNPCDGVYRDKVSLLSLNAKSDTFWQKMGFDFAGRRPESRATPKDPIPMNMSLNAPQQNPVAPDLTRSPPISRSRSASASGSTPPLQGSLGDL